MATFLLVQGAFEGGWYWKRLSAVLEERGHIVYRPTLTGLGERSHLLSREVDLDTHTTDILGVIKYEELTDFVLVGHSYGGMVITGVADQATDKIRSLVYLDAALPEDGQSIFDLIMGERKAAMLQSAKEDGNGWMVPSPPVSSWGIEDKLEEATMDRLIGPHPLAALAQPVKTSGNHLKIERKIYILAAKYKPSPFEKMAAWTREQADWTTLELPTHHFPMISMPSQLADMLIEHAV